MIINRVIGGNGGETASIFVTGLSETDTVMAEKGGKTYSGKWSNRPNPSLHGLPSGYTELEYIESTGTQYIDTGLSLPNGWKVSSKILLASVSTDSRGIFGRENYNGSKYLRNSVHASWGELNWFIGYGGYGYGGTPSANTLYDIEASNIIGQSPYIKINESNIALTNVESDNRLRASDSCWLFSVKNSYNGNIYPSYMRVYDSFRVWDNSNILVGEFIPCKRNSDNSIGMYDLVTNTFFANSGTGSFVAGAEVPQTIDGFLIDNIKSYGTYTITATDGTNTTTQDVLVDMAIQFDVEMTI